MRIYRKELYLFTYECDLSIRVSDLVPFIEDKVIPVLLYQQVLLYGHCGVRSYQNTVVSANLINQVRLQKYENKYII